ncbi:P-loop containing nucleoside triphosphate hydrolase protein [Xylariomycetidae sp. FL2044]|nr:P-loop containing nucleoside triphosphate hydrolase protein [Xylariomycetidae sp. FL2044]
MPTSVPWYRQLPRIPVFPTFLERASSDPGDFDIRSVIGSIQKGVSVELIEQYFKYYDPAELKLVLNSSVEGVPAIFYLAATHNTNHIHQWIKYGGDPNATHGPDEFPLIAFAILHGARTTLKVTKTVEALLIGGASPLVIPEAFYMLYNRDLPEGGPDEQKMHDLNDDNKRWCTPEIRNDLAATLTLTQRYRLFRAREADPPAGRERQLVFRRNAERILGLHHVIIGQNMATESLRSRLLVQMAKPQSRPLVLVFAGPSGHGKTELAHRLGELMQLELEFVDCTNFQREIEMFGPRPGFARSEEGSKLNNFLARKDRQRCIVFLDEFEKTADETRNALLIPFDQGIYSDRRNNNRIDCSRTIWIIATNALDDTIHEFCKTHEKVLYQTDNKAAQHKLLNQLTRKLRAEFVTRFKAPLTGRITEFLPFLTFGPDEPSVVAHKFYMDFEDGIAKPVFLPENKDENDERYVGNVRMTIKNDASIFSIIAEDSYMHELGARSLYQGVERTITTPTVVGYLKSGDEVREDQEETHVKVFIDADQMVDVKMKTKMKKG